MLEKFRRLHHSSLVIRKQQKWVFIITRSKWLSVEGNYGTQFLAIIVPYWGNLVMEFWKGFVAQIKNPTKVSCYSNFALSEQNICFSWKSLVLAAKYHRRQSHSWLMISFCYFHKKIELNFLCVAHTGPVFA